MKQVSLLTLILAAGLVALGQLTSILAHPAPPGSGQLAADGAHLGGPQSEWLVHTGGDEDDEDEERKAAGDLDATEARRRHERAALEDERTDKKKKKAPKKAPKKKQSGFELDCLAAHNKWRRLHGAYDLVFDRKIAEFSQQRADFIAASDGAEFKHPKDLVYGENLAWHSRPTKSCAELVQMWYDEVDLYSFERAKFDHETGHFTQLVWRDTKRVGCARAFSSGSNGGVYLVCNYDPPGNFLGEERENVLKRTELASAVQASSTPRMLEPVTTVASTSTVASTTTSSTTLAPISSSSAPVTTLAPETTKRPSSNSANGGGNKRKKNKGNKKKNKKGNKKNKNKKSKNKKKNKKKNGINNNNSNNNNNNSNRASNATTAATSNSGSGSSSTPRPMQ